MRGNGIFRRGRNIDEWGINNSKEVNLCWLIYKFPNVDEIVKIVGIRRKTNLYLSLIEYL